MPPRTVRASTREKRQLSQAGRGSASKTPRSAPSNRTRTIHQQVNDNSTMVAGPPQCRKPFSIICTPIQGAACRFPYSHSGVWATTVEPVTRPPPPWAQYYQHWPPLPPPAVPGNGNNASNQQHLAHQQWQQNTAQANQPWWPTSIHLARVHQISNKTKKINHL